MLPRLVNAKAVVAEVPGLEHDEALSLGRAEPLCPDEFRKRLTNLAQWLKAQPRHLPSRKSLDAQFPLLYIEPTPKRVLIDCRIVSGAGVEFTKPGKGRADD